MILFKYLDPDGTLKVLESVESCTIKFSLPRTYYDPYELFLQPTRPLVDEDERAYFKFFLGQILQTPVTCFSGRPDSVAMWAHYGRECTGACLGFDADVMGDQFSVAYLADVQYSADPATIDSEVISHAAATGKRRHSLMMLAYAN